MTKNKNVEGQQTDFLQHFDTLTLREIFDYVDRVALLTVKGCPFLCSHILTICPRIVNHFDLTFSLFLVFFIFVLLQKNFALFANKTMF
jgi:hypothetical protein